MSSQADTKNNAFPEVTRELLLKYDRPGPRYTSYPTAPEWHDDFGSNDYKAALTNASQDTSDPLSVYIHLPFCESRCLFCGCNVIISRRYDVVDEYLKHIEQEVKMTANVLGERKTVRQLHWGGGTPTYLHLEDLERLFNIIQTNFTLAPDAEIALEVDPCVTSREQLKMLRGLGFNRISMGVQDFDPHVQEIVTRNQTAEETQQLYEWCRELGFEGINFDLIYGLPEQRPETWQKSIDTIIDLRPDRLAVYSYAHLPERLKHQQKLEQYYRPTGPEKYDLFAQARAGLMAAGYQAIGMDHFALPTDELSHALNERRLHRNFMGYSVVPAADMIGFGISSIGEVGGAYAQNEKKLAPYYKALDAGEFPVLCGITLTEDDKIRRWLIRQIMCNFYLDLAELNKRFGIDYNTYFAEEEKNLQEFYDEGFLEKESDGNLHILPMGQVFIRNIAMVFDAYLKRPEGQHKFSRTV